jgi:hypothetical protein
MEELPFQELKMKEEILSNRMVLISIMLIKSVFMEKIRFWFLQEEEKADLIPLFSIKNPGFYYFDGMSWIYPSYFKGNSTVFNVLDVVADPVNPTDVFFANYMTDGSRGIYKMKYNAGNKDFTFVKKYDLGTTNIFTRRPVGLTFDDSNNLFASIAFSGDGAALGPYTAIGAYDRTGDDLL